MKKSDRLIAGFLALFVSIPLGRCIGALFVESERRSLWPWPASVLLFVLVLSAVVLACGIPSARPVALSLHTLFTISAAVSAYQAANYRPPAQSLFVLAAGIATMMFTAATVISIAFWFWLFFLRHEFPYDRNA